jgi:ribosomal protein S18 acetylase RimI-like enzyme
VRIERASNPFHLYLVGEITGAEPSIVATATLAQYTPQLCRHVSWLSLGVHPLAQRRGVGRAMLQAIVDASITSGVVRLELYVRADNTRAQALYRSLGFEHEGSRRKLIRLPDGTFVDDLIMVRFLNG